MVCGACGHENREEARFCAGCGGTLAPPAQTCASCGTENAPGARFCDACGHRLGAEPAAGGGAPAVPDPRAYTPAHLAQRLLEQRSALDGERKQVTVLFADVTGSMDLAERTDPEEWRAIMDRVFARLCEGVHRYEGTVVQFTGDGVMALFGAPLAHEDHAARAAWAALRLREGLAELAAELRREHGLSLSVRIGLNSGEVVVGAIGEDLSVQYTAIGHTVGLAQRMESLAAPGSVYVTQDTAALLAGYFELRDLGPHQVKGVSEPVGVLELAGAGAARSRLDVSRERGLTRFVGRESEMGVLEAALARVLDGEGQVVGVVGEAGVGKSRLCHEFAERCRARGMAVYQASCQSHARNVPYHAALEMVRGYFGVADDDDAQTARERVAGRTLLLSAELAEELPLIFDFLGIPDPERPLPRMDPEARQRRLLDLVRNLSRAHSAREPAVTMVEDAHWIDESSATFLEALVEAAAGCANLIVVNFRPEFRADWMAGTHYHHLPVVPLGAGAIGALIAHLLGEDPSLDGIAEAMRERTGGNPFFIEELVRGLVEDGTLEGERGDYRLARELGDVAVPATVHAVLAARIDRLSERDKAVLQAAAVVGREFGEAVLERVARVSGAELAESLRRLVGADFLYERTLFPEPQYAFRHPLTQEVAYGSQLGERRRAAHAAVAVATQELHADRPDELAALIAHHWERAGETLQAARWHARAAAWSGVSDPASAFAHWAKVREHARSLPADAETTALTLAADTWRLQLGWRLGVTLEEVEGVFREARALAEEAGDAGSQALLLALYGGAVALSGDMRTGLGMGREAMALARQAANPHVEVAVYPFLAYALMASGRLAEARAELDRARAVLAEHPGAGAGGPIHSPRAWAHMLGAFIAAELGEIALAREEVAAALRLAAEDGDAETLGWAHQTHGVIGQLSGTFDGVQAHLARCAEIANAIGSPFSRVWASLNVGWAAMLRGEHETAEVMGREAAGLIQDVRTGGEGLPWALGLVAIAQIATDRGEEGREGARRAVALAERGGVLMVRAFVQQAVGRVLLEVGDLPAAADYLGGALESTRAHGMRGLEALVHRDLADLAAARGDREGEAARLREAVRLLELNGAEGHLETLAPRLQALAA